MICSCFLRSTGTGLRGVIMVSCVCPESRARRSLIYSSTICASCTRFHVHLKDKHDLRIHMPPSSDLCDLFNAGSQYVGLDLSDLSDLWR